MTIANQVIFHVLAGQEQRARELLNTLVAKSLLEKGCQKFELYQLQATRHSFFIIEIWKSEKSYQKHLQNEPYLTLLQEIEPLLEHKHTEALKLTQCLTKLGLKEKKGVQ